MQQFKRISQAGSTQNEPNNFKIIAASPILGKKDQVFAFSRKIRIFLKNFLYHLFLKVIRDVHAKIKNCKEITKNDLILNSTPENRL